MSEKMTVLEYYDFLRNNGTKFIGVTYDISSRSQRFNKNGNHPSVLLSSIGRRWNKSNWLVPIQYLGTVIEQKEQVLSENAETYMTYKNEYDIVLYNDCMDDNISQKAFGKYCEYIREIHVSLVDSIESTSNKIAEKWDELEKEFHSSGIPEDRMEKWEKYGYSAMRQIFRIAENRLQEAITNSQLWEDEGRLTNLFRSCREVIDANRLAISIKYKHVFPNE